ncbi:acyloxyacyl hydrolase, partial [Cribrihabitans sp. XS_ASV171]
MKKLLLSVALTTLATQVAAQEVVFGAGYANYKGALAIDDAAFSLEYRHTPFFEGNRIDFSFGAALSGDTKGNLHAGVG